MRGILEALAFAGLALAVHAAGFAALAARERDRIPSASALTLVAVPPEVTRQVAAWDRRPVVSGFRGEPVQPEAAEPAPVPRVAIAAVDRGGAPPPRPAVAPETPVPAKHDAGPPRPRLAVHPNAPAEPRREEDPPRVSEVTGEGARGGVPQRLARPVAGAAAQAMSAIATFRADSIPGRPGPCAAGTGRCGAENALSE